MCLVGDSFLNFLSDYLYIFRSLEFLLKSRNFDLWVDFKVVKNKCKMYKKKF